MFSANLDMTIKLTEDIYVSSDIATC